MSNESETMVAGDFASTQPTTWDYMLAARRWLVWQREPNPDNPEKPRKVPYYVNGKRRGATDTPNDQAQLATYQEASAVVSGYSGLGFALGPDGTGGHWQGIDLDNITESGLADIANALPGYLEISPSGKGCHAVGYGVHFKTLTNGGTGIEAYASGRFFTVTHNNPRDNFLTDLAPFVAGVLTPRHTPTSARQPNDSDAGATQSTGPTQVPPATVAALRSALDYLAERSDGYNEWADIGQALKELGPTGLELWLRWSRYSPKFHEAEALAKWKQLRGDRTGYASIFKKAQDARWVNPASNAALVNTRQSRTASSRASSAATPLQLMSEHDLDSAISTEWIVKDVIPENSIGTLFGPSGTFKSFIALDALAHIANGWRWMGKRVKRAPCVYVPFEGKGGIPKRVQAWREAMRWKRVQIDYDDCFPLGFRMTLPENTDNTRIVFVMEPLNLREAADRVRLVDALMTAGLAGCVLCIDTLAQASAGIDENSSAMSEIISAFQELQRELKCSVLVVHHTGKNVELGMRGWSGIRGAMDFAVECKRPDQTRMDGVIWLDKLKDSGDGRVLAEFSMRPVGLGYDEDGDLISSLVVEPPLTRHTSPPDADPARGRDATEDKADDDFVFDWLKQELQRSEYPTGRSLEGQRNQMKAKRPLTQKRLRDAISRLKAASKVVDSLERAPHGAKFLRAVDIPMPEAK